MGGLGNIPSGLYESSLFEDLGSVSGTTHSMTHPVANVNDIIVVINNVIQEPTAAYTVSGTTLTTATLSSDEVYIYYLGLARQTVTPGTSTVTNAMMTVNSIDSDQYVDASIDTAHIATNQIDETLIKDALIGDFSDVTVTAADTFLYGDATDSGNTKKDTIQGVLDLVPASGSNGWKFISEFVASNDATVNITTGITSTYDKYMISITNLDPVDDDEEFRMKVSTDGGSNYHESTSDYRWAISSYGVGGARDDHLSTSTAYMNILAGTGGSESVGNATTRNVSVIVMLSGPSNATNKPMISWNGGYHAVGNEPMTINGIGWYNAGLEDIDAVEFYFEAGNVNTGNFALYGLVNS